MFFDNTSNDLCASGFLWEELDQVRYIHWHLLNLGIVEYFYVL